VTISATTQGIKPGVCLSTSRPVNPFDGQVIYMTDVDQTAVWDGTQWTVLAPIAGGRNGIINGAMNVWQRGTSSASQGYVTADRWFMLGTSTTFSQETSDLPANFRNALKYTMSGTAQPFSMQAIETQNSIRFAGKTVVLSYYVKTSNSTNAMVRIDSSNNVDESIQGTYSVIASNSVATTTSWRRVSSTFTIPSTSRTLRILVGSDVNLTSGQTILVTGIQLEEGAVATPFEFEDFGVTLAKCQRYYQRWQANATDQDVGIGQGFASSTTSARIYIPLRVTMRTKPSAVEFATLSANSITAGYAVTAVSLVASVNNPEVGVVTITATNMTANVPIFVNVFGSATGYFAFTAEL